MVRWSECPRSGRWKAICSFSAESTWPYEQIRSTFISSVILLYCTLEFILFKNEHLPILQHQIIISNYNIILSSKTYMTFVKIDRIKDYKIHDMKNN